MGRSADRDRQRRPFAAGLLALLATLACALTLAPAASAAPELPPEGKLLGFNDDMAPARHGITIWDYVELSRAAGSNAARTAIDWRAAEPVEGSWNETAWHSWTRFYEDALFAGIKPIFVIGFAPAWARDAEHQACETVGACEVPPSRSMDGAWARFAAEVAERFPGAAIQVWNEPNLEIYWQTGDGPDPERYAELLEVASDAIRGASPSTTVISGAIANLEQTGAFGKAHDEYLAALLSALPDLPEVVDEIGLNLYPYSSDIGEGSLFDRSLRRARATLAAAGWEGAPLAVTETGASREGPESLSEAEQAETVMAIVRRLVDEPDVRTIVLHRLVEPRDTSADPWEIGAGLVEFGSDPPTPYPAFCALAAAAESAYPGCGGDLSLRVLVGFDDGETFGPDEELAVRTPNFRAMLACSFNGAPLAPCGVPLTTAGLEPGDHTLTVHAIDTMTWQLSPGVTRSLSVAVDAPGGDGDGDAPPDEEEPEEPAPGDGDGGQPPDADDPSDSDDGSQGGGRGPPGSDRPQPPGRQR